MEEIDITSLTQYAGRLAHLDRVAVIASFSSYPTVSRSLRELVGELQACGYRVILVRASEDVRPLDWAGTRPLDLLVVRRPNRGYDFGSWASVLNVLPQVRSAEFVLLLNDSILGPFGSIRDVVKNFESSRADVWGSVTNPQILPHLQTFFYGFRRQSLENRVLRRFWRSVRPQASKDEYIWKYEIGLTRILLSEAFVLDSMFAVGAFGPDRVNPTLDRWRELVDGGFPFIKRALVVAPSDEERAAEIAKFVRERYQQNVLDWS